MDYIACSLAVAKTVLWYRDKQNQLVWGTYGTLQHTLCEPFSFADKENGAPCLRITSASARIEYHIKNK